MNRSRRSTRPTPLVGRLWSSAALVVVVALLLTVPPIYGWWLQASSGLAHAEGQRVQPAWEMLDAAHAAPSSSQVIHAWIVPRLFEQAYLRKPPGMPWAIAISGEVLGRTNASARLVSALSIVLGALVTFCFVRRWFGPMPALAAGLAFALLPLWYWYPPVAASAEIEALHCFWTLCAALVCVHLLIVRPQEFALPRPHTLVLWCMVLAVSIAGLLLTKGPAGLPVVGAVLLVARLVGRQRITSVSVSPWRSVGVAIVLGALPFVAWVFVVRRVPDAVTQELSEFLFSPAKLFAIASLPVVALVSSLPHAAFLTALVRPSLALPQSPNPWQRQRSTLARALAAALLVSLLLYTLVGISNNRYVLPALSLLPACVGGCVWWLAQRESLHAQCRSLGGPTAGELRGPRLRSTLLVLLAVLGPVCVGLSAYNEHRRSTRTTGEPGGARIGRELAAAVAQPGPEAASPTGDTTVYDLWGDEMFDIRPEVVMSAVTQAQRLSVRVRPRWKPLSQLVSGATPPLPAPGHFVLLRVDDRAREPGRIEELPYYARTGALDQLQPLAESRAHNFVFRLYRVRGLASTGAPSMISPAPCTLPAANAVSFMHGGLLANRRGDCDRDWPPLRHSGLHLGAAQGAPGQSGGVVSAPE